MATVRFKAKPESIYNMDDSLAWVQIKVPKLEKRHCDMSAFRSHPKFSGFANSDMFPAMLRRAAKAAGIGDTIRFDRPLPEGVKVDCSGFLAVVTIEF